MFRGLWPDARLSLPVPSQLVGSRQYFGIFANIHIQRDYIAKWAAPGLLGLADKDIVKHITTQYLDLRGPSMKLFSAKEAFPLLIWVQGACADQRMCA